LNGVKHGKGYYTDENGVEKYGYWKNDKLVKWLKKSGGDSSDEDSEK